MSEVVGSVSPVCLLSLNPRFVSTSPWRFLRPPQRRVQTATQQPSLRSRTSCWIPAPRQSRATGSDPQDPGVATAWKTFRNPPPFYFVFCVFTNWREKTLFTIKLNFEGIFIGVESGEQISMTPACFLLKNLQNTNICIYIKPIQHIAVCRKKFQWKFCTLARWFLTGMKK